MSDPKSPRPADAARRAATARFDDDGGAPRDPPPVAAGELTQKPAWSVLSLRDLNEAIRRERQADDPARLAMEAGRAARAATRAAEALEDELAAAARARRDRHRNPWENT
jgi:hypothetical protein